MYKKYRVKLRRDETFQVKPEAEQLDGKVFELREMWVIEDEDTSLPIVGEKAMSPRPNDETYPKDAPIWIASGDLGDHRGTFSEVLTKNALKNT